MKCNTATFRASDGAEVSFPLDFLVERGAVIADEIGGEPMESVMGCANQLWIPGFPAKYFLRDIVAVEFSKQDPPPVLPDFRDDGHDFTNRPNVSCKAPYSGIVGEPMVFEGWADDFDKRIAAVEYSLDERATWKRCEVEGADATRWVWWRFAWVPREAGSYTMHVRAVNEDGLASPHPATHSFVVEEAI